MIIPFEGVIEYSELVQNKEGWNSLKDYIRNQTSRDAMISLGMEELYCSWFDIEDVLGLLEEGMSFAEGITTAYYRAIEIIESKLCKGYSTHDFDIDMLTPTPAIRLIPIILELRKIEVESAKIYFTSAGNRINVRNLKKTYYGMKLMRELQYTKFTRRVSREDFQKLKQALEISGLKIREPKMKLR